jgi:polysaccharide export outer membrane protein
MIASGQRKALVALAAVLGITLGNTGCQNTAPTAPLASQGSGIGQRSLSNSSPVTTGAAQPTNAAPNRPAQVSFSQPSADSEIQPALVRLQAPTPGPGPVTPAPTTETSPGAAPCSPAQPGPVPTELFRTSLPPYTIAPPDILFIDILRLVPRPPYRIEPLETLVIKVTETLPGQPIEGAYVVSPEGTINLGYTYGTVRVTGLTLDQIQAAIRAHLSNILRNPQVVVALAQFRAVQQTRGEHLVRPDGTVNLGTYGCVYVSGLTVYQAKCAVEQHLSKFFLNPQVSVDVMAYNSKVYYVIFDGGGYGMQVLPFPVTGNETVLDAISRAYGLAPVSSVHRIWVARPAPPGHPCDQILPVDWLAIVKGGSTATNYQLFPGDRVYVDADCLIKVDNWLAKIFSPIERVLGVTLLGTSTAEAIHNFNNRNRVNGVNGVFIP